MSTFSKVLYSMVGEKLKSLRINKKLSQTELSAKIPNIGRTSISNIEKGKQHPPLHILYQICNELDIDIQSILPAYSEIEKEIESKNKGEVEKFLNDQNLDDKTKEFLEKLINKNLKND